MKIPKIPIKRTVFWVSKIALNAKRTVRLIGCIEYIFDSEFLHINLESSGGNHTMPSSPPSYEEIHRQLPVNPYFHASPEIPSNCNSDGDRAQQRRSIPDLRY